MGIFDSATPPISMLSPTKATEPAEIAKLAWDWRSRWIKRYLMFLLLTCLIKGFCFLSLSQKYETQQRLLTFVACFSFAEGLAYLCAALFLNRAPLVITIGLLAALVISQAPVALGNTTVFLAELPIVVLVFVFLLKSVQDARAYQRTRAS